MRALDVDGDQRQSVGDSKNSRMMATKDLIIAMFGSISSWCTSLELFN